MRNILYAMGFVLLWTACSQEETVEPSMADRDWFRIAESSEGVDGLRYEIYKNTGISVLYNDTLGSEIRYDRTGEPYTYYEILKMGYNLTTWPYLGSYKLVAEEEAIQRGVEVLRDKVIPLLSEKMYPRAFLLSDSLLVQVGQYAAGVFNPSCKDVMVTYVGNISQLDTFSTVELERWVARVACEEIAAYMTENYAEETEMFFDITNTQKIPGVQSSGEANEKFNHYGGNFSLYSVTSPCSAFGFLKWIGTASTTVYAPSRQDDLAQFLTLVYGWTEEEVEAEYGSFPVIMKKYEYLKILVGDLRKEWKAD